MSIRSLSTLKEDQPLVEIALTLKFSRQANFTRAFREATGHTPAQYRRSVGMIAIEPAAKNDNSRATDAKPRSVRWCIY
jgi:AraC family transcriptional regulator